MNYKDFNTNQVEKDLINVQSINESIKNILTVNIGTIAGFPEFSMGQELLFEQLTDIALDAYRTKIKSVINKFDKRIQIQTINIVKDPTNEHSVVVEIYYLLKDSNIMGTTNIGVRI